MIYPFIYLKKINYAFFFISIFLILNINLFLKTELHNIDYKELFKIAFPVISLFLINFLNNKYKLIIFKLLVLLLFTHVITALLINLFVNQNIFEQTSDYRYYLPIISRGPGDTALSFCILFISSIYYFESSEKEIKGKIVLYSFFIVSLILILTQSRTWLVIFILFLILMNKNIQINYLIKLYPFRSLFFFILLIISFISINPISEMYKRSSYSFLSGRVDLWILHLKKYSISDSFSLENKASVDSSNIVDDLFGKNLERKLLIDKTTGIETSDSHNILFDISQTYGLFGAFFLIFSYLLMIRKSYTYYSLVPVICFSIVGIVMSPFKVPYLFYTNILILLIPMIYWKFSRNK